MLTVIVKIVVKAKDIEEFKAATIENASKSNQEEGINRFDIIQESDNPQNFMLVEVYKTPDAPAKHKETSHYLKWRDTVASMMEQPRTNIKYTSIYIKDLEYEL